MSAICEEEAVKIQKALLTEGIKIKAAHNKVNITPCAINKTTGIFFSLVRCRNAGKQLSLAATNKQRAEDKSQTRKTPKLPTAIATTINGLSQ